MAVKWAAAFVLIAMLLTGPVTAQKLFVTEPSPAVLVEGDTYAVAWSSEGLKTINIIAYGTRTPIGTQQRGTFSIDVAGNTPADRGSVSWKVPWIDASQFTIKMRGYDSSGRLAVTAERTYNFRPAVLAKRLADGIYLDLSKRYDQRLYVQKDGRIVHVYLVSSSENYLWEPTNVHPMKPHDHAGVFRVQQKEPDHWSKLAEVHMLWAMRYLNGHYIHATSSNLYRYLGRPASHGCNRMTRYDAKQLYDSTPIGTRVEVIGPNG